MRKYYFGVAAIATLAFAGGAMAEEMMSKFADVKADAYYAGAVEWAHGAGIVKGMTETEFGVGKPVTREDVVVMLQRYHMMMEKAEMMEEEMMEGEMTEGEMTEGEMTEGEMTEGETTEGETTEGETTEGM